MANILVTGADGQVGNEFRTLAALYPQHRFLFSARADMDITKPGQIQETFASFHPEFCINCAAYTAVDKAEGDRETAFAINGTAVRHLADACNRHAARLVHISTDYVFNGNGNAPYPADHPTDPVNVYGQSKLQGEREALSATDGPVIIRTSWVYSTFGNNFVKTMIRLMQSRPEISVVSDQKGSPTYAADLAAAILHVIGSKWNPGIYHYSNTGIISWFDFAIAIKELSGAACAVKPIQSSDYPTPARRPHYSAMDTSLVEKTFNLPLKSWKTSLEACLLKMK